MGVTCGGGTANPSGAPDVTPSFQLGSWNSIFSFMSRSCRSLFVLLYFCIGHCVMSLLRYTDSDYAFGIFKLFLMLVFLWGIETLPTAKQRTNSGIWTCVFDLIYMCFVCNYLINGYVKGSSHTFSHFGGYIGFVPLFYYIFMVSHI